MLLTLTLLLFELSRVPCLKRRTGGTSHWPLDGHRPELGADPPPGRLEPLCRQILAPRRKLLRALDHAVALVQFDKRRYRVKPDPRRRRTGFPRAHGEYFRAKDLEGTMYPAVTTSGEIADRLYQLLVQLPRHIPFTECGPCGGDRSLELVEAFSDISQQFALASV